MALNWRNLLPQWLRSTEPPKAHPIESPSTEIFISRQSITRCVFDNAEEKKKANAPIVLEWNNIATILKSTFETPFSQEQQAIIEAIENIAARIEASNDFDRFISFQRNDIQTLRNNCALIYEAKNTILDKKRGLPIEQQGEKTLSLETESIFIDEIPSKEQAALQKQHDQLALFALFVQHGLTEVHPQKPAPEDSI